MVLSAEHHQLDVAWNLSPGAVLLVRAKPMVHLVAVLEETLEGLLVGNLFGLNRVLGEGKTA